MRTNTSKIELFVALLLAMPSGAASAAKPVSHKAAPARPKASARETKLAASNRDTPKASKARPTSHAHLQAAASHAASPAHPSKVAAVHEKPAPIVRRAEPAEGPVPEQEQIQVTHDRKQHHAPESPEAQTEPRKATSADFLTPFAKEESEAPLKHKVVAPQLTPTKTTTELVKPEPPVPALLYTRRGKLIVPPALKGSHEILLHQNEMADRDGLDRIRDDEDLDQMREDKLLVPIPTSAMLVLDERLPANRRYTRPWTAQFLTALARAHYARFHSALQVNSAVRTVEFQQRLLLTNGNAAPAGGETASPHLTGQAIDLAKHGLSLTEIAWLRGYLMPLVQAGKVDVEEEFQQACFHISVYKKYVPQPAPKREIADTHHGAATALATAIR
jgi:hypothetical protein